MFHVVIDGSGSMNGAGKVPTQQNIARFIRQSLPSENIKFWFWQDEIKDISPSSLTEDIKFEKNRGKTDDLAFFNFIEALPNNSDIFILTDGFSLNRKNLSNLQIKQHRLFCVLIGPDALFSVPHLRQENIVTVAPEDMFQTLQNLSSKNIIQRPLTIDPSWFQADNSVKSSPQDDKGEW